MGVERHFRASAIGGFNRKDVIEYIEELLKQIETANAELDSRDKKIAELEQKLKEHETARQGVPAIVDMNGDADEVLSQVDMILKAYLGDGA